MLACASPAYLQTRGRPQRPADLAAHDCLLYTYNADAATWRFAGADGEQTAVQVAGALRANNGEVLLAAAVAGAGIILQPAFIAGPAVADGRLVPVLEGWCASEFGVYAVYPRREFLPAKARTFVDFLAAKFAGTPPWEIGCPVATPSPAAPARARRARR
jgi:DNA-binding transcriptional LysR family regulator